MTQDVPLIPREVLLGNPERVDPTISPDSTRIAWLAPVNNVLNVWVKPVGAASASPAPVTSDTYRGIRWFFWSYDNQHILYGQDAGGDENWRLYATNIATRKTRDLTPFKDVQVQVVHRDKHFPDEIVIALNKEQPQAHDAYRLNTATGQLMMTAKNPGNIVSWLCDGDMNVRGAWATHADGSETLLVRDNMAQPVAEWRAIATWSMDDAMTSSVIGLSRDGSVAYLRDSRGTNTGRFVKLDLATGESTTLVEEATWDVTGVIQNPETYEPQIAVIEKERKDWVVLDESIKDDIAAIRKLHPGDFWINSRDAADQTWIIGFVVDDGPLTYFTFDRKTRTGTVLLVSHPAWANYTFAKIKPISFTARDGLTIHGYLTLPPSGDGKPMPMVLDVHGGPWGRNVWGHDPQAQWLANRGYACLQVNFRGSTGYGKAFVNAGDREWGAKMHADLIDAVNWAVSQGIADPKKVAIFGWSYGGYAALVGATFTPDVFCCAVDFVGPSNLVTLLKSIPPYWEPLKNMMYRRVGSPDTEPEFLESRSPVFKANRIKIPVLVGQGANDPRVKQTEAEQIVAAMKHNGVDHEYLLFEDEGHGFERPENRVKAYAVSERFLAKYLGGRCEAE